MFKLLLLLFVAVFAVDAVTKAACKAYCKGETYDNCAPETSFYTYANQTCYNKCVTSCVNKNGTCMTNDTKFRCCLSITAANDQLSKIGCSYLYYGE